MNIMIESPAVGIACTLLGSRIKAARIEKNITQEQLSEIIGVSRGKITSAERGYTTTAMLVTIMFVLGREDELDLLFESDSRRNYSERKTRIKKRQRASRKHD